MSNEYAASVKSNINRMVMLLDLSEQDQAKLADDLKRELLRPPMVWECVETSARAGGTQKTGATSVVPVRCKTPSLQPVRHRIFVCLAHLEDLRRKPDFKSLDEKGRLAVDFNLKFPHTCLPKECTEHIDVIVGNGLPTVQAELQPA